MLNQPRTCASRIYTHRTRIRTSRKLSVHVNHRLALATAIFGVALSVSACSSRTLYEKTDIHYVQACGGEYPACDAIVAQLTDRCQSEHSGQVVLRDDLRPNRVQVVCRPAPEEKPSTGTPLPKADTPPAKQALQASSPQGLEAATSVDAASTSDTEE